MSNRISSLIWSNKIGHLRVSKCPIFVTPYNVDGKFSRELNYVYKVSQGLSVCVCVCTSGGCKLQLNIKMASQKRAQGDCLDKLRNKVESRKDQMEED